MEKIKNFFKKIWKWLRKNILNKKSIIPALLAELVFWSPLIVLAILGSWKIIPIEAAAGYAIFWLGPWTPGLAVQLALISAFCGIANKIRQRRNKNGESKTSSDG